MVVRKKIWSPSWYATRFCRDWRYAGRTYRIQLALERRQEEEREAMETQAAMLALRRPTANGENQQHQVIEIRQQQRSYQQPSKY